MATSGVLAIDGVSGGSRLVPSSADELAASLKAADDAGEAVAAVGGGTQLDLGMPPSRLDVVIETTGLKNVVEYEPADLTITVEAGIRFGELQRILGEQGQFLALDPALPGDSTIGGIIATNASGPLRFSYGTARDLVIGTRVANPDGTLTRAGGRVVKNVAGYDLNKLYIGSLGTLAIVVELSFKLAPVPPSLDVVVGSFPQSAQIRSVVDAVIHSPLSPLAIEMVGSRQVAFRLGGYPPAVERQVRDLSALIADHGGSPVDAAGSYWDDLAAGRVTARQREVFLKASAPISTSVAVVEILERGLAGFEPMVWAHAGNGVVYAAFDAPADARVLSEIRREVTALGDNASLVIERCPTALKHAIDVWGDPGPSIALMRALKAKLDPKNTLNPGRYVGGI